MTPSDTQAQEVRVSLPEKQRQHQNWAQARARLMNAPAPPPKPKRPRPLSPFNARRAMKPKASKLFTKAIEELDEYGNIVIPGLFIPQWKRIALECAEKHGVTFMDLLSARRDQWVVKARHEAFWRCKHETTLSLPQIGDRFGGRDHTTVIHGVRKHALRMGEANAA